jgi:hypothetical protein
MLLPGYISTGPQLPFEADAAAAGSIRRSGTPAEIAACVLFFAHESASFVTGAALVGRRWTQPPRDVATPVAATLGPGERQHQIQPILSGRGAAYTLSPNALRTPPILAGDSSEDLRRGLIDRVQALGGTLAISSRIGGHFMGGQHSVQMRAITGGRRTGCPGSAGRSAGPRLGSGSGAQARPTRCSARAIGPVA